jgi:hypothetical protein
MAGFNRQSLVWAVLAFFLITWTGIIATCCAEGDEYVDPGDPASLPPTCETDCTSAGTYELSNETLEPTPGILSDFWMILMAMAYQLAL